MSLPPFKGGENWRGGDCGGVDGGAGLFIRGSPNLVILVSSIFSTGLLGKKPPGGGFGLCPGLDLNGALTDILRWVMGLAGAIGGGAIGGGGRNDGGGGDLTDLKPAGKPVLSLLLAAIFFCCEHTWNVLF